MWRGGGGGKIVRWSGRRLMHEVREWGWKQQKITCAHT